MNHHYAWMAAMNLGPTCNCNTRAYAWSQLEVIPIQQVDEAFDRAMRGDARYRFVIDMASLRDA